MKTGIELIAQERDKHPVKHGRTIADDVKYNKEMQLAHGAEALISKEWSYGFNNDEDLNQCPSGWDYEIWIKMYCKPYKQRLIIAGALIAAEIDRLIYIENQSK